MPPSFILPKRSVIELEYGSAINLSCHASGMPRPRVRWHEGVCFAFFACLIFYNSIYLSWFKKKILVESLFFIKHTKKLSPLFWQILKLKIRQRRLENLASRKSLFSRKIFIQNLSFCFVTVFKSDSHINFLLPKKEEEKNYYRSSKQ